jgi:hypothetical protein
VHGLDYYELLGVGKGASDAEIKSAYRSLARAMHPDTGGTSGTFRLLREAYETLNDPVRRAEYDEELVDLEDDFEEPSASPVAGRIPQVQRAEGPRRFRRFGEDPNFVPPNPLLATDTIAWWPEVDVSERVLLTHGDLPGHGPAALAGIVVLLLPIAFQANFSGLLVVLWLLLTVDVAVAVYRLATRYQASIRSERAFTRQFGGRAVFGRVGTDADQWGERLTADLLSRYLARLPGARIFHGLAWPGSVFADIDHAVLAGRRLVLIESKTWLPGHYAADSAGGLWRNGRRFRGGGSRLAESLDAYRDLLPGVEIRGALIIYPSRDGEVSTAEALDVPAPPMTPEQFVDEIGAWLAVEPSTVDAEAFGAVLDRVVSTRG